MCPSSVRYKRYAQLDSVSLRDRQEVLRENGVAVHGSCFDRDVEQKAGADQFPQEQSRNAFDTMRHRLVFIAPDTYKTAGSEELSDGEACKGLLVREISVAYTGTKWALGVRGV